MSRIGKKPVTIPDGVSVTLGDGEVVAKGPKGELRFPLTDEVITEMTDDGLTVTPRDKSKRARSMWGMTRSMVDNIVTGVSQGFTRKLEITGVGYRAAVQGKNLQLQLGFSHDVQFPIPDGIDIKCPTQTEIEISGIDKQVVGELAAKIRGYRPPEPYKGKGVRYAGEYIFRKEGKKK